MKNPFKALGRAVKKPVVAVKEKTEMAIAMGIARHLVTTLGGYLVANGLVSDDQSQQLVGALVTVLGIGLSAYKNYAQAKEKAQP